MVRRAKVSKSEQIEQQRQLQRQQEVTKDRIGYQRYRAKQLESQYLKELRMSIEVALPRERIYVDSKKHQEIAEKLVKRLRPDFGIVILCPPLKLVRVIDPLRKVHDTRRSGSPVELERLHDLDIETGRGYSIFEDDL